MLKTVVECRRAVVVLGVSAEVATEIVGGTVEAVQEVCRYQLRDSKCPSGRRDSGEVAQ